MSTNLWVSPEVQTILYLLHTRNSGISGSSNYRHRLYATQSIWAGLRCYILLHLGGFGTHRFLGPENSDEENFGRIKNLHPFPVDSAHFCFHRGLKLKPVCISTMHASHNPPGIPVCSRTRYMSKVISTSRRLSETSSCRMAPSTSRGESCGCEQSKRYLVNL